MSSKLRLYIALLIVTAACLIGCGSSNSTTPPPPQTPQTTLFAFMEMTNGYLFTPMIGKFTTKDGSTIFTSTTVIDPITNQPLVASLYSVVLSPDGKKVVFDAMGPINGSAEEWDIWVVNSEGSGSLVQLTNDPYVDCFPQLSPDGKKVVFATRQPLPGNPGDCGTVPCQFQIALMNVDGTGTEQLLPVPEGILRQYAPIFSPDGKKIAMMASGYIDPDTKGAGILLVNADGTNPVWLTHPVYSGECDNCQDEFPSFIADGTKIAFSRLHWNPDFSPLAEDIYIMNADGSNMTKLTDGVGLNSDPLVLKVAGAGERILFNSNRDNLGITTGDGFELYSMKTDGTGLARLTTDNLFDGMCAWWMDGPGGGDTAAARGYPRPNRPRASW